MTDFGTIVTPYDVSQAVEQTIRTWQRTALDAIATDRGFSRRLESIRSYRHTADRPEKWDEDAVPCCVIVTRAGEAGFRGDEYSLFYTTAVAVVVGGTDQDNSHAKASAYGGALALLLTHERDLGFGEIGEWGGFDVGQLDRNLAMAVSGYTIHVPQGLTVGEWPAVPVPDPQPGVPPTYPPDHTAEHIQITVDQLAQEG